MSFIKSLSKANAILTRRFKEQGFRTTLLWMYARGLPALTGIPILKFSRVTDQIFVGPQHKMNGLRYLKENGVNAVVNMRLEKDDAAYGLAPEDYCYLPTIDDMAPSHAQLDAGVEFIDRVISSGGKVYIHCSAGVGRAPTMAAAYLVKHGYSLEAALNHIRQVRPFIYIMPPQMECLRLYEGKHQAR